MKISRFRQSLGELEAEVMEIIWQLSSASVREVLTRIRKKKKVAYTTIMTVMARLHDKGILKRELDDNGAYIYAAIQDKEKFLAVTSKKVIRCLLRDFGDVAVAQFIDIMENGDSEKLKEWRRKLKKILI